jgi:hypothetical protein
MTIPLQLGDKFTLSRDNAFTKGGYPATQVGLGMIWINPENDRGRAAKEIGTAADRAESASGRLVHRLSPPDFKCHRSRTAASYRSPNLAPDP